MLSLGFWDCNHSDSGNLTSLDVEVLYLIDNHSIAYDAMFLTKKVTGQSIKVHCGNGENHLINGINCALPEDTFIFLS